MLRRNGWTVVRRSRHGVVLERQFEGETRPRRTVISPKHQPLATGTLAQILGPKQTKLGRAGLEDLLQD